MRHKHEITDGSFTGSYEHDDFPKWHMADARTDLDHDHPAVLIVGGSKFTVTFEGESGDTFHHGGPP